MTRWILSAFLMSLLLLLAACGSPPADPEETPVQEEEEEREGLATVAPVPTRELPTATPEGYPVQPTAPSRAQEGYPEAPPPPTAYPVDMRIWVLRPLGTQCEESDSYQFATVEEAVASLTDAGVEVFDSEMTSLVVCESCNCPTSEHFRVQILRSDLYSVQIRGWTQES